MGKKFSLIIIGSTIITVSSALIFFKRKNYRGVFHIKSYDGMFDIAFSNDWKLSKEKNELNENSNLEAINTRNGICFIMFSKNKSDLNNISLEEYNDTVLHSINSENIISSKKKKINNKYMYITEFDSYYESMLVHYLLYTLETENHYHQVMTALINNNRVKNNIKIKYNQINNILSTIREL